MHILFLSLVYNFYNFVGSTSHSWMNFTKMKTINFAVITIIWWASRIIKEWQINKSGHSVCELHGYTADPHSNFSFECNWGVVCNKRYIIQCPMTTLRVSETCNYVLFLRTATKQFQALKQNFTHKCFN